MSLSVVCGKCKALVSVVNRRYALHDLRPGERCPVAGAIHRPEVIHRAGGGAPHTIRNMALALFDALPPVSVVALLWTGHAMFFVVKAGQQYFDASGKPVQVRGV